MTPPPPTAPDWVGLLVLVDPRKGNELTLIDNSVRISALHLDEGDNNNEKAGSSSPATPLNLPLSHGGAEDDDDGGVITLRPVSQDEIEKRLETIKTTSLPVVLHISSLGGYVKLSKLRRTLVKEVLVAASSAFDEQPSELKKPILVLSSGPGSSSDAKKTCQATLHIPDEEQKPEAASPAVKRLDVKSGEGEKRAKSPIAPARLILPPATVSGSGDAASSDVKKVPDEVPPDPAQPLSPVERSEPPTARKVLSPSTTRLTSRLPSRNATTISKGHEPMNNVGVGLLPEECSAATDAPLPEQPSKREPMKLSPKKLVPYFSEEAGNDPSCSASLAPLSRPQGTGQEQVMVRLVLADAFQILMIESHLDEIEFENQCTIFQRRVPGEDVLFLSIFNGDPSGAMNKILDWVLTENNFRKQECLLVVDSLSTGTVTGQQEGTKRKIENECGVVIEIRRAEEMDFDIISEVLPNEKILVIKGNKMGIIGAANSVYRLLFKSYDAAASSHGSELAPPTPGAVSYLQPPPHMPIRSGMIQFIEVKVLVPIQFAACLLSQKFQDALRRQTSIFLIIDSHGVQDVVLFTLQGTPRCVREAIYIIFKSVVERHCYGNFNLLRMPVQFKEYQTVPQDLFAYAQVAERSGCLQFSDWSIPDVTFTGTLYNIISAMSYMVGFY